MWFRLAALLGMSVARAQSEISSAEFAEWIAYFNLEPMPNAWLQHGILCTLVAQAVGDKRAKPEDFIPKVRKIQSQQEIAALAKAWAASSKGGLKYGNNRRD